MSTLEKISEVFSIFHDGVIEGWTGNKSLLTLEISCTYLAELIDPSFTQFYIELISISKIELELWLNESSTTAPIVTDFDSIFKAGLEIMQGDIEKDSVLITCLQSDKGFDYTGGNLYLSCDDIRVYDQNKNELTIDALGHICKVYWDKFGKK